MKKLSRATRLIACSGSLLAGLLASLAGLTVPCANAQGTVHTVHIYNFDFSLNPAGQPVLDPTIVPGDTVRWVWDQGFHSTTAAAGQLEVWDSGVQSGGTFDRVFAVPGVFTYYSRPFGFDNGDGTAGGMSGTITVIPEPSIPTLLGLGLLAAFGLHSGRLDRGRSDDRRRKP